MVADCLIIGAGLSGIMATRILQEQGKTVHVFDKGRSVGGRMATRRVQNGTADHGAQFFTVRSPQFREYVDKWLAQNLVYEWAQGWNNNQDGHARYATHGGMNKLVKYLAESITDIHVDTHIKQIDKTPENTWKLTASNGQTFQGKSLLLTAPVPQSLVLLDVGNFQVSSEHRVDLENIRYGECLCGLFVVDGEVNLPSPGALQTPDQTITWIADNQAKGISPDEKVITVHAGVEFSHQHYEDDAENILSVLQHALERHLHPDAEILEAQLKRWRYSIPLTHHSESCLVANENPKLIFAGDAFGNKGRVEGAFLSGLAAGQELGK